MTDRVKYSLAYYGNKLIASVKKFMEQSPELDRSSEWFIFDEKQKFKRTLCFNCFNDIKL